MTFNFSMDRHGVELRFSAKPDEGVRSMLKANGFRWSPANGTWWRRRVEGTADFLAALERKLNPGRPDGACWRCGSPDGFFRPHGAATPVFCAKCHAENQEAEQRGNSMADVDCDYEEQCHIACGL
jgi:hypothetical protein